jgi:type IV pilus assembly protein PilB
VALYEVMQLSETLKGFVLNGASAAEIKQQAIREEMTTLRRSALNKVAVGMTTLKEIYRVSSAD